MKKLCLLCLLVILSFSICGCIASVGLVTFLDEEETAEDEVATDTIEDIDTCSTEEEINNSRPILDNDEYWDIVKNEIVVMLNSHNLYVSYIDSLYPAIHFTVEPGKPTEDGEIIPQGLSQSEYEKLFESVKTELHVILDKYQLAQPKTAFHACDSVVGIFFYNWFIDDQKIADKVDSLRVAHYQIDLLEYYYSYENNIFVNMEGFSENHWLKYSIYTPEE